VILVCERLAAATAFTPVPERLTLWVLLPVALSVRVTEAARAPAATGLKATLMVQLAPAATLDPQVFVCAKSAGLAPASAMPLMLKAAVPLLLRVIV